MSGSPPASEIHEKFTTTNNGQLFFTGHNSDVAPASEARRRNAKEIADEKDMAHASPLSGTTIVDPEDIQKTVESGSTGNADEEDDGRPTLVGRRLYMLIGYVSVSFILKYISS